MNREYVDTNTIFECIIGSRLYGVNTPESDYDKAGVMIPDKSYFYGFKRFEQFEDFPGEDKVIYDIRKAVKLISDNNPNMLDLISVSDRCVIKRTWYWQSIVDNKNLFISKRCRFTYSGYAFAQLKRIKNHRKFLLNPPKNKPDRIDFGLQKETIFPTTQLKSILYSIIEIISEENKPMFLDGLDNIYRNYITPLLAKYVKTEDHNLAMEWLHAGIKSQANTIKNIKGYIKDEYRDLAEKEVRYYNAYREWKQYQQWKQHRNKKRAEMEKKFGYDPKHSMHLIRLMRMCKEILETGKINADRINIDAEELIEIRNGLWSYEKVENYADDMEKEMEKLYKTSILQKSPQVEKIQDLLVDINEEYLKDMIQ